MPTLMTHQEAIAYIAERLGEYATGGRKVENIFDRTFSDATIDEDDYFIEEEDDRLFVIEVHPHDFDQIIRENSFHEGCHQDYQWVTEQDPRFPTSKVKAVVPDGTGREIHLFCEWGDDGEPKVELGVFDGYTIKTDISDVEKWLPRRYWPAEVWAGSKWPEEKRSPLPALVEAVKAFMNA